jgi:hypothetical protein
MSKRNQYTYHQDGEVPDPDDGMIFVFGSNLAGLHGKGAALVAKHMYGAEQFVGEGITGSAYALPTKDRWLRVRNVYDVKRSVCDFLRYAKEHPDKKFFVTAIGTGLAGFKHHDVAPMFRGAPTNCNFPKPWRVFLE